MDLESAAQIGEALGGFAILLTMLFGLRQMAEWTRSRRNMISQNVSAHLSDANVQLGMSVIFNYLDDEVTLKEISALTREEKNGVNAIMVGLNNHAIMTFQGYLALDIVTSFYQPYSALLNTRIRRLAKLYSGWTDGEPWGVTIGPFDWVIWLLDRMEEQPALTKPVYKLHSDWKG